MKNIGKALLRAQENFKPIVKETQAFNYKYAPLDQVLKCVQDALRSEGILITQPCETSYEDESCIGVQATVLTHVESGETMESKVPLLCATGAQDRGSEITYMRRYTLLSLLGVHPQGEDDDGAAAQAVARKRKPVSKPVPKSEPEPGVVATYNVFLESAKTFEELQSWWDINLSQLNKLKKSNKETWTKVVSEFSKRKNQIENQ